MCTHEETKENVNNREAIKIILMDDGILFEAAHSTDFSIKLLSSFMLLNPL